MQIWNSFFFIKLVQTKYPHQIHMKHIKLPYILIATLTFPTTIITNLATNLITNSHQYHHPYCYLIYTRCHKKVVNLKMEAFSLTVNICVNSWSNLTTRRWNPQEKLIPNIEILTVKDKASIFGLNTFFVVGCNFIIWFCNFQAFQLVLVWLQA